MRVLLTPEAHTTLNVILSVIWNVVITFRMTFLMSKVNKILSWMMDEFIHSPKPELLLPATCDEILSRVIEIWMKTHLVSDNICNTINL